MIKIDKKNTDEKGTVHDICSLNYSLPKEITLVFHNESNYDYHFIIKEL